MKISRFILLLYAFIPARIAAILHVVPDFFPLFSPRKGSATDHAVFCGQIRFFAHFHFYLAMPLISVRILLCIVRTEIFVY
jgi:hypothetical protein